MSKWTKIALAMAALAFALLIIGSLAAYYFISKAKGQRLANDGYVACLNHNYDLAVTKLSAALQTMISREQKAYAYLNRGVAYQGESKWDDAIRDFTAAIQLDAKVADAYADRGLAFQHTGNIDKAFADFSRAIGLDPNSFSAFYNRGRVLLNRRDWRGAAADLIEAARCQPESADALVNLALCYLGQNDVDHALASLDGAIAIDPRNARAYTERSKIYSAKGDWNRSFRDLTEAEKINPPVRPATAPGPRPRMVDKSVEKDNPYFDLYHKAMAASSDGDFDRAIELYDRILMMDISPSAASGAVMDRGNAYRSKKDWGHALRDYDEAIKLSPTNAGAYVNRADMLSHNGEHEDAIKDLNEALRLKPNQWEAFFDRAADLRDLGQVDQAIADLEQVIKLNPKFADAYVNRGSLRLRTGDTDQAIADYKKAIELNPHSVAAYQGEIIALLRRNKIAEASRSAKKMMEIEKSDAALNSVAWFLATSSDSRVLNGKAAVKAAEKACNLSQWKNWAYIDTLAAAYAENRDFDQAVKYQEQVLLAVRPDDSKFGGVKQRLELYKKHQPYRQPPLQK